MKKLIYILVVILLVSCSDDKHPNKKANKEPKQMFKLGDMTKLKVDSSNCIIVRCYSLNDYNRYVFKYRGEENEYDEGYAYEYEFIPKH